MPTIAWFNGIAIRMYFRDHPPPHFEAIFAEHYANISIATGEVINGHLPKRTARLLKKWTLDRQPEVLANWSRARANLPLERISGLDDD